MKKIIKLTENDLHKIIENSVKRIIKEDFDTDYENTRSKFTSKGGLWGMEAKNNEGEWEYGEVTYDPNTKQLSCLNTSIHVDPDFSIDENLQALADAIRENGYEI